jgi:hypothetical protein
VFAVVSCNGSQSSCETRNTSSERRRAVILAVGKYDYEQFAEGQEEFLKQKCPVTDCWITSDYSKYNRTADALILMIADSSLIKEFIPKPSHQVQPNMLTNFLCVISVDIFAAVQALFATIELAPA